jgi:hypothetical protein
MITLQHLLTKLAARRGLTRGESKRLRQHFWDWMEWHRLVEQWDHDTFIVVYDDCVLKLKVRGNTTRSVKTFDVDTDVYFQKHFQKSQAPKTDSC